jgi:uncharacterized cupin superfamily protein
MRPFRLAAPLAIPSIQLEDWGPVKEPEGDLIPRLRGRGFFSASEPPVNMGIWECSPGRWRRENMVAEFAYFIAGRARFFPDLSEPFDVDAGDAVWFPGNCKGTWDILETLRKTYLMVGEPGYRTLAYTLMRQLKNSIPRSVVELRRAAKLATRA